ncbi:MAG: hypothetical protein ACI9DH_000546 [Halioglobus sp.]|jgi:hypothetical protein
MSELESKAIDILDKIEAITSNYAPTVAEAAIEAVRISAIGELVYGFVGLAMLYCGYLAGARFCNYCSAMHKDHPYEMWDARYVLSSFVLVFCGAIGGITAIFCITDIWVWTSIFNPELGLAHKLSGL